MNQPPPQIPTKPLDSPVLRANIAFMSFNAGNGGITLYVCDQREAAVEKLGDPIVMANYELGRYELTPRALRTLLDSATKAAKGYAEHNGRELPTVAEFEAAAAMPGIQNLLDKAKDQPQ